LHHIVKAIKPNGRLVFDRIGGYPKSRHLDDKAGVAVMLAAPPAPETVAPHERLRRGEPI
jgi:putative aminopeptidase FrvX